MVGNFTNVDGYEKCVIWIPMILMKTKQLEVCVGGMGGEGENWGTEFMNLRRVGIDNLNKVSV